MMGNASVFETAVAHNADQLLRVRDLRTLVGRNEDTAWDAFARQYYRRMLPYAWRLTENADEADELVQEVVTRFYRVFTYTPDKLDDEQSIFAWLARAIRNRWIDEWRRKQREPPVGDHDLEEQTVADHARRVQFELDHRECLKFRSQSDLQLLQHAGDGLSVRAIEQHTGVSRGVVNRRLQGIQKALKRCLERQGWTEEEMRKEFCYG